MKDLDYVFWEVRRSLYDQPITNNQLEEVLDWLRVLNEEVGNNLRPGWVERLRGFFHGLLTMGAVGVEVIDDLDKALLREGFIQ